MIWYRIPKILMVCCWLLIIFAYPVAAKSKIKSLKRPQLISPLNGSPTVQPPVTFTWRMKGKVAHFELELQNKHTKEKCSEIIDVDMAHETERYVYSYEPNNCSIMNNFEYGWRIRASTEHSWARWSKKWSFFVQENVWLPFADEDEDGIPNITEGEIGTDWQAKTLFIRPIEIIIENGQETEIFWERFYDLFKPSQPKPGFVEIEPLSTRNIEVVIIGCPKDFETATPSWHQEPNFDEFTFAPEGTGIPCDIMDLKFYSETDRDKTPAYYKGPERIYIQDDPVGESDYYSTVNGHTYFIELEPVEINGVYERVFTWRWDHKGYTDWGEAPYKYYIPELYGFALNNYFNEGAYNELVVGSTPDCRNCLLPSFYCQNECKAKSIMTSGDTITVEFHAVDYNESGTIESIEYSEAHYVEDEVLRRTIVHEIGHALLGDASEDHCENPNCIFNDVIGDWKLHEFGGAGTGVDPLDPLATSCQHSAGGGLDISQSGVVLNETHELAD